MLYKKIGYKTFATEINGTSTKIDCKRQLHVDTLNSVGFEYISDLLGIFWIIIIFISLDDPPCYCSLKLYFQKLM